MNEVSNTSTQPVNPVASEVENPVEVQTPPPPAPKKSFPIKTLLLIIFLAIITGGLLWIAFNQNQNPQQLTKQIPTVTPDPVQTILTISSVPVPLASPSSYQTDVVINTGQNKINSVQLELLYDPKVLKNVDITPGGFFIDPLVKIKNIDLEDGRITYILNVSPGSGSEAGVLGQGIIARIRFTVPSSQKSATTSISFEPKTQVLGPGFSNSLLKSTVNASFTVGSVFIPTKTPTATPSAN